MDKQATNDLQKAARDAANSGTADKIKGHARETLGMVKQNVGEFIGDDKLAAEGAVQRAEGKIDRAKGEIKGTIEDVKDKIKAGVEIVKDKLHGDRKP
ncbi:MAG: CsbD family protein [Solimonas sp.]